MLKTTDRIQNAVRLQQLGQFDGARRLLHEQLALVPDDLNALHFCGALEYQAGQYQDALRLIDRALQVAPALAPVWFNHALCHLALGDAFQAALSLESCLTADPTHLQAHLQRGRVLAQLNRPQEALQALDQALQIGLQHPDLHSYRGNVLLDLERPAEALLAFEQAVALDQSCADYHNNKANALRDLVRLHEALTSYTDAISLAPQHVDALNNRGNLWLQLRNETEAWHDYQRALQIAPNFAPTYRNLGSWFASRAQPDQALNWFDQSLALNPNDALAHMLRGEALRELQQFTAARECFERAFLLNPQLPGVAGMRLQAQSQVCDWKLLDEALVVVTNQLLRGESAGPAFSALGWFDDPQLHFLAASAHARKHCPTQSSLGPIEQHAPNAKIRLGYYSADFHNHATAYLTAQLFELHDRTQFEVYAFSFGVALQDEMRSRLQRGFDHFIDVRERSDVEIAALSRQLQIDIAIDLKGYCKDTRAAIFAHRCAPIQVSYLAYPGTLGASFMDYIVADKIVLPPDQHAFYTEKVAYLPHSYQVNDATRLISKRVCSREEIGLPAEGFVFCSFNNNYKILPATFDQWMRIVRQVDGSVLWLLQNSEDVVRNLRQEASLRGVDPHRLIFSPYAPLAEHLARHRLADLCLDTLPYNAHTTASDALWAGLPVLTLMGKAFAGRVAASLLTAAGMPELITHSAAAYEALAIDLASNSTRLAKLREQLAAQRDTCPLFNTPLLCKNLEAIYQEMHRRSVLGLAPESFDMAACGAPIPERKAI